MANGSTGEDMTVFQILDRCGKIVFANESMGLMFTWDGKATFGTWQSAGFGKWYLIDEWTLPAKAVSLESAVDRCRERLSLILADEGSNEYHDMLVDRKNARRASRAS
jgi:hypothetical protein